MIQIIGLFLAGLGLFFTGITILSNNLKQLSGRRFRQTVAKWTEKSWMSGILGAIAGSILQSAAAITFIIVGMIRSGLISVRKALPIISWANVGLSTLVLVATLDIKIFVLFLLGISGLCFAFDRPVKYRALIGTLLGIGLLFQGLFLITEGSTPFQELEWFKSMLMMTQSSYILAFVIGTVLTVIAQSSAAVSVVAITMTSVGLFSVEQTMMIIYGTNVGSSLVAWLMSGGLKGTSKQIAMFQVIFDFIGGILFIGLFYLEVYLHIPLVKALVSWLPGGIEQQMAYVYLIYNLAIALLLAFIPGQMDNWLKKHWPPTAEEDESKVEYIHDQALIHPESAMELVEKEHLRLARRFPKYMTEARQMILQKDSNAQLESIHSAFNAVAREVQTFLTDLVDQSLSSSSSERLLNIQNRHSMIISLEDNLYRMVNTIGESSFAGTSEKLSQNLVEGLDAILLTTIDAMESEDEADQELLINLTQDRGKTMEKIRKNYLSHESELDLQSKTTLLYLTNIFERMVWMIHRLSQLLKDELKM
jgi:phosphate:Na+ symporter